jgi:putative nucleotidyltransferase-like protein
MYHLLADLLVGRSPTGWEGTETDWAELVALAGAEGVAPLLHCALRARPIVPIPAPAREMLAKRYLESVCSTMANQSTRARLCRRLAERSIPALLLKGAALSLTCYEDPATRPMGDIDMLVPRSRVEEAARCAEEDGFKFLSGSLARELRSPRSHLVCLHPVTHTCIELHWELKGLGPGHPKVTAEIWSAAQTVPALENAQTMRLGHTIPLLAAHMTIQHFWSRLLWLHDIHRLLLTIDDQEAVVARDAATRWRLGPATAHVLLHVRELFHTPLPDPLARWAHREASRPGLQAWIAALALTPDAPRPPGQLLDLLMNRNWSLLPILLPTPAGLRDWLRLPPHQPVAPAYLRLMRRKLFRSGPLHIRQFWRCWRAGSRLSPPCGIDPSSPTGSEPPAR